MEGDFQSQPPAKRPSPYISAAMSDPSLNCSNGSSKRPKQPQLPLHVPPGHVVFRLLCHASRIGGVIGKSGTIIKQLQQSTGAKIRIEDSPPDSPDRVVIILSSAAVTSKMSLSLQANMNTFGTDGNVELEVSKAQEALVRVFERILEVAAESDGLVVADGVVSCRLLVEKNQAGSVIGKGGKVVEQLRKESGCRIRILKDNLPTCATAGEEIIEIEGEVLGVKKALIGASRCLQDCIPVDKGRISGSRNFEAVSHQALPEFHVDIPQKSSTMPARTTSTISYASRVDHLAVEIDRMPILESKAFQRDVVYKILCPVDRVGGVIGKGGSIIRSLQNETGASISVEPILAECNERVIVITASESQETRFSPAQKAAILVFARSVDAANEKGEDSNSSKGNSVVARLLIPSKQVGCLLGKGGVIISEIRSATGAYIRILVGDQVPMCASENEEVVQISGDFTSVQDALYNVTGRLRDNTLSSTTNGSGIRSSSSSFPAETSPYGKLKDATPTAHHGLQPSLPVHHSYNTRHPNLAPARTDYQDYAPPSLDSSSSPNFWESTTAAGVHGRGLTSLRGGATEPGSRSRSAIVTNTTVEISVPEDVLHCVYGEKGSNLTRLRQISGAKVNVYDALPGKSHRRVVISGTPDQTQAAQSLLHAFILTGS